jgi:hypothetical protein
VFENDYFTPRDKSTSPYNTAERLNDDGISSPGATYTGLKYVNFLEALMSVSDTDPETKDKYGTYIDENGKEQTLKKGVLNERIRYSWIGITGNILNTGTEDLSPIRSKAAPYVLPIPSDRVMSSGGVLNNDGYGIVN